MSRYGNPAVSAVVSFEPETKKTLYGGLDGKGGVSSALMQAPHSGIPNTGISSSSRIPPSGGIADLGVFSANSFPVGVTSSTVMDDKNEQSADDPVNPSYRYSRILRQAVGNMRRLTAQSYVGQTIWFFKDLRASREDAHTRDDPTGIGPYSAVMSTGTAGDRRRYFGFLLPLMNLVLAQKHNPLSPKSAAAVMEQWYCEGFVLNEEHSATHAAIQDPLTMARGEKIVNLVYRGRTGLVSNIWHNSSGDLSDGGIDPGTYLWFILCRVPVQKHYVLTAHGDTGDAERDFKDPRSNTTLTRCPWQFVPWAHRNMRYPPESLMWSKDEWGWSVRNAAVCIARVAETTGPQNRSKPHEEPWRNISSALARPQLKVDVLNNEYLY